MDPASFIPIVVALIAGGGVAFYTARPRKDSIIATASKTAVEVVNAAIERLQQDLRDANDCIGLLEARIVVLERDLAKINGRP